MTTRSPTSRPRAPIGLIIVAALAGATIILAVLAWLWFQWDALQTGYPLIADTLRIALFAAPLALGIYGAAVALQIAWRRWGERPFIEADKLIALTKAQRQFPDALSSLSYSFHDSRKALPPPELVSAPALVSYTETATSPDDLSSHEHWGAERGESVAPLGLEPVREITTPRFREVC